MKYFTMLFCAGALVSSLSGCISEEVEPQHVVVCPLDGSQIISKDLYEINSIQSIDFGNSRVFPLYNAATEGLPGNYDINIVVMEPQRSSAVFTQKVSQIIYVLTGGGMLKLGDSAYELREGISLYIPANQKMQFINNGPYVLKYMEIATPSGEAAPIVLEKAPEVVANGDAKPLSDKELLKESEKVTGNAATSPTLDQIAPITLDETLQKSKEKVKKMTPLTPAPDQPTFGNDKANTAIIDRSDNITNPPPVKPVNQSEVETLTPQEKIMQDKQ